MITWQLTCGGAFTDVTAGLALFTPDAMGQTSIYGRFGSQEGQIGLSQLSGHCSTAGRLLSDTIPRGGDTAAR